MRNLLIIPLLLLFCACGARRKSVHSLETRNSYKLEADSLYKFMAHLKEQSLLLYEATAAERNKVIEYDGQSGDSLNISEYGPDGQLLSSTVITGNGKAKISEGTKQEQVKASETTQKDEQKSSEASGNRKINAEASTEALDKNVKSTGSILQYWWVLLLVLGALWYLNKRYGWWTKIKSHVTGRAVQ